MHVVFALFGGLLIGSGFRVLVSNKPIYPKPIAAVFVLAGTGLALVGLWLAFQVR